MIWPLALEVVPALGIAMSEGLLRDYNGAVVAAGNEVVQVADTDMSIDMIGGGVDTEDVANVEIEIEIGEVDGLDAEDGAGIDAAVDSEIDIVIEGYVVVDKELVGLMLDAVGVGNIVVQMVEQNVVVVVVAAAAAVGGKIAVVVVVVADADVVDVVTAAGVTGTAGLVGADNAAGSGAWLPAVAVIGDISLGFELLLGEASAVSHYTRIPSARQSCGL